MNLPCNDTTAIVNATAVNFTASPVLALQEHNLGLGFAGVQQAVHVEALHMVAS